MKPANRYEIENARHLIDGYYIPRPGESAASAYDRAKDELKTNLLRTIEVSQSLSIQDSKS